MFRMDKNRRVALLAVVVVLSLGSPPAAAGWEVPSRWMDSGDFLTGFTHVLAWLGVKPTLKSAPTCVDQGMGIDPNGGCSKALGTDQGSSSIDLSGAHGTVSNAGATTNAGMGIDPNGLH